MPRARLPRYEVDQEETRRIVELLRTMLRVLPMTNREVERRLGYNVGYLSRLFSGSIELKLEQVIAICRVAGLKPGEFFRLAYGNSLPETEAAKKLQARLSALGSLRGSPQVPDAAELVAEQDEPSIEEQVHRAMTSFYANLAAALPPVEAGAVKERLRKKA